MEVSQAYPNICGCESRTYLKMECTMADLAALYAQRKAEPGKMGGGTRRTLSSDEEWYLWTLYDHCTQKKLALDLNIGKDKVPEEYKRLQDQGGPKGAKPEWMK